MLLYCNLQTDIEFPEEKPLSIISIRRTSRKLDIWLDTEMFITSALFRIARIIPLIYKLDNSMSKLYTYLSTFTIRNLENLKLKKNM